jgi:hypothetical protein
MKLTLTSWQASAALICAGAALAFSQAQAGLLKASPAPPSSFLEHPQTMGTDPGRTPFNRVWRNPDPAAWDRARGFNRIVILPVNTAHLKASPRMPQKDVQEMACYMQGEFRNAFARDGYHHVMRHPGPRTLELELALVELRPTNVPGNVLLTGASVVAPGVNVVGSPLTHGTIAFEAKLRNAETGELLAQYSDREFDKLSAASLRDYSEYAHGRKAVQDWALQMQRLASTPPSVKVPGAMRVTLNPL